MALTVEQLRTFDSNWGNLVVQQDANGQKPSFSAGESRLGTTERFTVSKDEKGAITVGFSMRFEAPNMVLDTAKETKDATTTCARPRKSSAPTCLRTCPTTWRNPTASRAM